MKTCYGQQVFADVTKHSMIAFIGMTSVDFREFPMILFIYLPIRGEYLSQKYENFPYC